MKYYLALLLLLQLTVPGAIARDRADRRDISAFPVDRAPAGLPVWADSPQTLERTVAEGPSWYRDPKAMSPEAPKPVDSPIRAETVDQMAPALQKNPYVK
jgi:hypothetical protein